MPLTDHAINRLRSQLADGRLILFTGAGFSCAALDRDGRHLPSSLEFRRLLHSLCYPGTNFDEDATLGELFQIALNRRREQLQQLLQERLTVDPATLPDFYQLYFDCPWKR